MSARTVPIAVPPGPARRFLRTMRLGYWLGWQIESNWTDPLRFFVYSLLRPLGGALILVVMFNVVARGGRGGFLGFFIVGSAFWPFVVSGMSGMAVGIIGDREHYRTLKYVYTSPIPWGAYLVGRALAVATGAIAAAAVTIAVGRWAFGVPIHLGTIDVPYTFAAFVLGVAAILALGLLVVSLAMSVTGEAWRMPEGIGAALYLLCGAIFPVTVLPGVLQAVSKGIPLTWWLEAMRRGILGPSAVRSLPGASDLSVLGIQAALTVLAIALAMRVFALAEHRARALGMLDRESGF